jgi:hypothetical protein
VRAAFGSRPLEIEGFRGGSVLRGKYTAICSF